MLSIIQQMFLMEIILGMQMLLFSTLFYARHEGNINLLATIFSIPIFKDTKRFLLLGAPTVFCDPL